MGGGGSGDQRYKVKVILIYGYYSAIPLEPYSLRHVPFVIFVSYGAIEATMASNRSVYQ